jgi:hypothetical protein
MPPKTRLPFISPASFPELSSKIARFSFLPSIFFLFKIFPNPGEGEISPDPKIAKLLSFWKEWTDKYGSQSPPTLFSRMLQGKTHRFVY